jgi:MFS family permease
LGCFAVEQKVGVADAARPCSYIMMGFGLADAMGSMMMGLLSDKFGRARVLALGFLLQGSIAVTLVFWSPEKGHFAPPVIMALILGLGDAAGQIVYTGLCSAAFPPDEVCGESNL